MTVLRLHTAALAVLTFGLPLTAPAMAQESEERINQLIIYGDDPCPQSSDTEITVCARKDESERYRIPEPLRGVDSPANDAWSNKVLAYETVGKSGTLSCSPVGAGGWTGCLNEIIETAYAEKGSDPSVRFSELIAEERAKRLSTIDATAAEQQADVEDAEREYFEKKEQQAAPADGE